MAESYKKVEEGLQAVQQEEEQQEVAGGRGRGTRLQERRRTNRAEQLATR
jgi:hypothetical protein